MWISRLFLEAGQRLMGDPQKAALTLGQRGPPYSVIAVTWNVELLGEQTNDRFQRDPACREVKATEGLPCGKHFSLD